MSEWQAKSHAFAQEVSEGDAFAPYDEFMGRLNACDHYDYLFVCRLKDEAPLCDRVPISQRATCLLLAPEPGPKSVLGSGALGNAWAAIQLLPRLPDAAIFILTNRWQHKGTLDFLLGVLFVLVDLAIMIIALRQNAWAFIVSIAFAPLATSALFWLIQHGISGMSDFVAWVLGWLIVIGGIPLMVAFSIKGLHDAQSLREAARAIGRGHA
jgi:hypothetical protein